MSAVLSEVTASSLTDIHREMTGESLSVSSYSDTSSSADTANNSPASQSRSLNSPSSSPSVRSITTKSTTKFSKARGSTFTERSKEREEKLRGDPNVTVLGPHDVACKRCGTNIKLSTKSTWDPCHWYRHKERCAKRPDGALRSIKDNGVRKVRRKRSPVSQLITAPAILRSLRPRIQKDFMESTPPLTPDDSDDAIMRDEPESSTGSTRASSPPASDPMRPPSPFTPASTSSPSPSTHPLPVIPQPVHIPQPEYDPAFDEYLLRSRRRLTSDYPAFTLDDSKSWSWSILKEPVWVLASYPNHPTSVASRRS